MRGLTWRVGALLFGSGCCALIYQIAWLREFRLIFGASTAASAAVLAIFIGGLGVGGLLLGQRADGHRRPILFYSQLETIIALSAAVSPFLLTLVRAAYIAAGGTQQLGLALGTISRLALSALVLAVPTIAMGGTLPAAARGVTRQTDVRRQGVAALYAMNTLGAVFGAGIATFFLVELFGTRMTLWLAAAINLLIAIMARQVDRALVADSLEPVAREAEITGDVGVESQPAADRSAPAAFVLLASGIVGFVFFLMELVWYRMLGPLLGGSVFTFGLILAVALAGIGAGSLTYALGSKRPPSLIGFALSCLLEAATMAAAYAFGDRLALVAILLFPLGRIGFLARVVGWTIVAAVVVLLPAVVAGYQFPLLIGLFGRGRDRVGRQVGLAYATNTIGAIAGSLAGGFGLLPWLSAPGVWRLSAACLVVLGIGAGVLAAGRGARRALVPTFALTGVTVALLFAVGPTAVWRHSGIGVGRGPANTIVSPNELRSWQNTTRRSMVWDGDGTESSVALMLSQAGYAFVVNGKSDGSARGDSSTQVMLGLLGAIVHPNARRSLVIGLGTGSSAGWLGAMPSMERVDVVELERLVVDVARACEPVNREVLKNPKVKISIGDARERLLTSTDQYDLIVSGPSNPFRAGIASLFTREYYHAATNRLNPNGVFIQWIQTYEVDARTIRTVYATLASVFPYVETWEIGFGDVALVGATRPLTYSASAMASELKKEPLKTGLAVAWHAVDVNGVLAHFLAGNRLTRTIAQARESELNTDDRNIVEFGFARSIGNSSVLSNQVRDLAREIGDNHPPLRDDSGIDWAAVETARVSFLASVDHLDGIAVNSPPGERARQAALFSYYGKNDLAATRDAWRGQSDPRDPTELSMVADLEADAGVDGALASIERLRAYQPGEADVILAELRMRQSKIEEATAALESAFQEFRVSPWAGLRYKRDALALAHTVAAHSPEAAHRMFMALRLPFSVRALQNDRLFMEVALAQIVDFRALCQSAVGAAEPYVPWTDGFLAARRDCYQAVGDPRFPVAARELNEYLSHEPLPLANGLRSRAP